MERQDVKLTREDLAGLASFRKALRKFLHFAEETARAEGLTPQQHQALLAIRGDKDRDWAMVAEIAEALQLRHHATVELIDRCQAAGLVERSKDPNDRRVVRVALTQKGEDVLHAITRKNLRELRSFALLTRELERLTEE